MKIYVFADSHGDSSLMKSAIEKQKPDIVIHCGDGIDDIKAMEKAYPDIKFHYVKGNCDTSFFDDKELVISIEDYKFYITHGDKFFGKDSPEQRIADYARAKGASIVLHGHTHEPTNFVHDDIQIFNPGCATPTKVIGSKENYGIITIEEDIFFSHMEEI